MTTPDLDRLLAQTFSGDPPSPAFRAQVLRDSAVALRRARRSRARRQWGATSVAAVLLAGVSFLGGRLTMPPSPTQTADPGPGAAPTSAGVAVPDELVAWLDAAQLFRRLGMEERMGRAIERAGKLRPYQTSLADDSAEHVFANVEEKGNPVGLAVLPRLYEPIQSTNGIMAHSLGGYSHASERD